MKSISERLHTRRSSAASRVKVSTLDMERKPKVHDAAKGSGAARQPDIHSSAQTKTPRRVRTNTLGLLLRDGSAASDLLCASLIK